jgi:regulator of replication initiation timing
MQYTNDPKIVARLAKREQQLEEMSVHLSTYNEKIISITEENDRLKQRVAELEKKLSTRVIKNE